MVDKEIIHTCTNCGIKYRLKFMDTTVCLNCNRELNNSISEKLKGKYSINYSSKVLPPKNSVK